MTRTLRAAVLAPLLLASLLARPASAAPGFHAAWIDESPWPTLRPGGTVSYTLHFRNTGTETCREASPAVRGISGSAAARPDRPARAWRWGGCAPGASRRQARRE